MKSSFLGLSLLILLCGSISCTSNNTRNPQSSQQTENKAENELAFALPTIPQAIADPKQRALYLVEHFWDNVDWSDDSYLKQPEKLEASFANYLAVALSLPLNEVKSFLLTPLNKSKDGMLTFFINNYEKYLHDPNSPMLQEEYYIPILEWIKESPKVELEQQVAAEETLKIALLNRIGQKANDFIYLTQDGSAHHLKDVHTPHTLLIFYVPGCSSCEKTIEAIKHDSTWREYVNKKCLNILFIYAEEDVFNWNKSLNIFPDFVQVGYNQDLQIITKPLYDLKASPSIYLLDNAARVELKDTNLNQVLSYLKC